MSESVLAPEPGPGGTCRVCSGRLDGALRCSTCGAAYGESNRCPHCGTVADIEESSSLRQRCRVCGGPRVAIDDAAVVRSGRERGALRRAKQEHARAVAWRVGAAVVGAFGLLSLLVMLLVLAFATPGALGSAIGIAVAVSPLLLALYGLRRGARAVASRDRELDAAWALAASDVMRDRGREIDARELARLMRLSEDQAEQLLARLSVEDFVRARVSDTGDLLYEPSHALAEAELEVSTAAGVDDGANADPAARVRR